MRAWSQSATSSSSTASSISIQGHDTEVKMPITPEQLECLISRKVTAALTSATSRELFNSRVHDAEQMADYLNSVNHFINAVSQNLWLIQKVAKSTDRLTATLSSELFKASILIDNGGYNKKRKDILTILGGEDLLNGTRQEPINTPSNPTGYTRRRQAEREQR